MTKFARQLPRTFAPWLVALFCTVWPLATWHELTTTHAVCAEHGEVLDVASCPDGDLGDDPRLVDLQDDSHATCAFAPLAQPAEGGGGPPPGQVLAVPACAEATSPEVPRVAAFPRYLLAPKQSPPRGIQG